METYLDTLEQVRHADEEFFDELARILADLEKRTTRVVVPYTNMRNTMIQPQYTGSRQEAGVPWAVDATTAVEEDCWSGST